jgi:hypothetical protein
MPKLQTSKILSFVFALLAVAQVGLCQANKTLYSSYKATADSIIKLYYGDNLLQYISFDSSKSYYRTLKTPGAGTSTAFTEALDFEPEMFRFHYYFKHPAFQGDTLNIKFYVDQSHRIMQGFLPEGLYDMKGKTELQIIPKSKAMEIAKKAKIKEPQEGYVIEFGWHEHKATNEDYIKFKQTKDIKQIVKSRIVWKVTSKFRDPPRGDEKPYVQAFIIDAVTGELLGVENISFSWCTG